MDNENKEVTKGELNLVAFKLLKAVQARLKELGEKPANNGQ